MRRRWKILLGAFGLTLAAAAAPILYIETACTAPLPGLQAGAPYRALLPGAQGRRDEARTFLTYPEWTIVYSADSLGRFIETRPPSEYAYFADVRGFWSGYCALNRAAAGSAAGADAKVMLYTIGLSFSAEMILKGLYEKSWGRAFEWLGGGARSGADAHSVRVQQSYGAFMHEAPWYRFGFGDALAGLWASPSAGRPVRHWERRFALSAEYGAKSLYAGLIGWASGAALGRDELTLRFVARAAPEALTAVDTRLRPVAALPGGLTVVEAPRYAQFTQLLRRLAASDVELAEIAGNDDIFVTILAPDAHPLPPGPVRILAAPLGDRPGWSRIGLSLKVPGLLPFLRNAAASGAEVEHVYDY